MKFDIEQVYKAIRNSDTQTDLEKLSPDVKLRDIGADSLDMFNILLAVQDQTGIEIPDEDIEQLVTARDISEYLSAK